MTPEKSLKVGPNDRRKVRRSRLLQKWKAEIESESVGSRDYRKMRLAQSLYRTQSFCNSGARWRTGSSLILETRLFIEGGPKWRLFWNWEPNLSSREGCNQNRAKNGSVPNSGIKIIYQWKFKNYVWDNTRVKCSYSEYEGCGPTWGIIKISSLIFVFNIKGRWNVSEKGSCTSKRF